MTTYDVEMTTYDVRVVRRLDLARFQFVPVDIGEEWMRADLAEVSSRAESLLLLLV